MGNRLNVGIKEDNPEVTTHMLLSSDLKDSHSYPSLISNFQHYLRQLFYVLMLLILLKESIPSKHWPDTGKNQLATQVLLEQEPYQ